MMSNPGIDPRFGARTALVWTAIAVMVAAMVGLQALTRYAGGDGVEAPATPESVGSLQVRLAARHGIGSQQLGSVLGGLAGQAVDEEDGRVADQIIDQLRDASEGSPVQLVRSAGAAWFLRPTDDSVPLAMLDEAREFIEKLPENQRGTWEDRGYLDDIASMRRVITEGADALRADERDRLVERYEDFARMALAAELDGSAPERERVEAMGMRTTVVLLAAFVVVVGSAGIGLVLFVIACVLVGTGRLRGRYLGSLVDRGKAGGDAVGGGEPAFPALTLEVFALFLAAFLVVQIVVGMLVALAGVPDEYRLAVVLPFYWGLLGVALWPLMSGKGLGWTKRALGWHRGRGFVREAMAGLVGYLAGLPIVAVGIGLTLLLTLVLGMLGFGDDGAHPAPDMLVGAGPVATVALIVLATCWAPVVEETFFRGALFHHLRRSHGFVLSGLVTGFLFAVIHPQGIIGVPVLTAMGFVFAMIREWRGSLIAPIVAHAINNGFVFTMLLVALR